MRRGDRLAEVVEIIRDGRLHTARELASALEVSERTVYRDIDTLIASGVPIQGERGVGYLLRAPVFLPALALSPIELEALNLGMHMVSEAADHELQAAARTLLDKVEGHAALRRRSPAAWGFGVYASGHARAGLTHMPLLRRSVRERMALSITYRSLADAMTDRIIRPLQNEFWGRVWTCSAWCELRGDFRAFRIDRMTSCTPTGRIFEHEPGKRIEDCLRNVRDKIDHEASRP